MCGFSEWGKSVSLSNTEFILTTELRCILNTCESCLFFKGGVSERGVGGADKGGYKWVSCGVLILGLLLTQTRGHLQSS